MGVDACIACPAVACPGQVTFSNKVQTKVIPAVGASRRHLPSAYHERRSYDAWESYMEKSKTHSRRALRRATKLARELQDAVSQDNGEGTSCLLYTSPSPRDSTSS
eukprot:11241788-Prorocentrum_lima.AAC.1